MSNTLETKFLEKSTCYFCGEDIHNYELTDLFDGRMVKSCFKCFNTVEIGKAFYHCEVGEIDIPWDGEYEEK